GSRSAGFYPSPRQYIHSEVRASTNNNNVWGFGTPEVDELIRIYEEDLDFEARLAAIHRVDEMVQEQAFYIPFWSAPYVRVAHWDYIVFPEFHLPRRAASVEDYMTFWIDPERRPRLDQAMQAGTPLELDPEIDRDYYGVRERLGG